MHGGSIPRSDTELLVDAACGDVDAFAEYNSKRMPGLLHFCKCKCREMVIDTDLARDFAHDAIIAAYEHVKKKIERGLEVPSFSRSWLFAIAHRKILDHRKRRDNQTAALPADEVLGGCREPSPALTAEERDEVRRFLDMMNEDQRQMVEDVFWEGMTIAAAGEQIGMSKDRAYRFWQQTIGRLHEFQLVHGREANEL